MARIATTAGHAGRKGRPRQRKSATTASTATTIPPYGCTAGRSQALDAANEEIGGERGREGEERVHAPEAPVHRQHPRGGGHDSRCDAGATPVQPPAEVVTEQDGTNREDDGDPAERISGGVEEEREVDEDEMERRPAAIPHRRGDHLSEGPRGDEPGHGLVFEERL
jgi:hypothetical protein